ncbi:MAG: Clp protease N-terminal domain-containing protein [Chloroflexota bacterium]
MPDARERLTPRARRVLTMAEDEAVGLRLAEVGTEHVLVALLREGRGLATRVLQELGVEPAELAQRVRSRLTPAEIGPNRQIGLGPGAKNALQMARAEATRLHHDYVGTEHLLLGLLRDGEGPAFVTLIGVGVTLQKARQKVLEIINESSPEIPVEQAPKLAILRGRDRPADRYADPDAHDPRDDVERCGRCGRVRRPDWRFCAFCGERWPTCERCDTPIPELAGVRFCPGCGTMYEPDVRA